MDDKSKGKKKPLRTTANKTKDLYNTYLKNQGVRNIPINTPDEENENMKEDTEVIEEKAEDTKSEENTEQNKQGDNDDIIEIVEQFEQVSKEKEELLEQLRRKTAEMENFRRRTLKEKQDMLEYANERLLFKLLPILDDFGAALEAGRKSDDYRALLTGIEMIQQKSTKLFEEAGVKTMESPIGQPFDVELHEAIMMMPSNDIEEGNVIHEVQKGYTIGEKVLRHAKVVTSSGAEAQQEEEVSADKEEK